MIRLSLTNHYTGKPLDIYVEKVFTVSEDASGACRCVTSGAEEFFVKETREQIAAQVQP